MQIDTSAGSPESKTNGGGIKIQSPHKGGHAVPFTKTSASLLSLSTSDRHVVQQAIVEPKVYSPHKTRRGQVPRRIEVERRKRDYGLFDINREMEANGVLSYCCEANRSVTDDVRETMDRLPLSTFDDDEFDSQSIVFWRSLIDESKQSGGLPARAMFIRRFPRPVAAPVPVADEEVKGVEEKKDALTEGDEKIKGTEEVKSKFLRPDEISWVSCHVMSYDAATSLYTVKASPRVPLFKAMAGMPFDPAQLVQHVERIHICFDAEDPVTYCARLEDAVRRRKTVGSTVSLNLYVDCMPMDNLRPLDSEQVNRILQNAINMDALRKNSSLDTSTVLQQYNLNHMRTLNQIVFVDLLRRQLKNLQLLQANFDVSLFPPPSSIFRFNFVVESHAESTLDERMQAFRFASLLNKVEAKNILLHIQHEIYGLKRLTFFASADKTLRVEEFAVNQQGAIAAITQAVKETWLNSITNSVRNNLKDVKKGWFNIEESSLEVYSFSKLKKFMKLIEFMIEDSLRSLMTKDVADYCASMLSFCPDSVTIHSNESVTIIGGNQKFPLFTVDLKFVNATADGPAKFVYSALPETLFAAMMQPFDQAFTILQGIVKVERRVMKKLFWTYEPVVRLPHAGEAWATALKVQLESRLKGALQPMTEYLGQLSGFMDLISIEPREYAQQAEAKFCPSPELLNLPDLCKLAVKHSEDSEAVFHMLPSSVSLGIVVIDCKSVKGMLSQKHKSIATKLFEVLERKTKEYAEGVIGEFKEMFEKLCIAPHDIEGIAEMREYMATLPQRVDGMADRITRNDMHYSLMTAAKWKVSIEQMDSRWDVFRWPHRMAAEIQQQEKNLRSMEYAYKKTMEDEQGEFASELGVLASDIQRLKTLTELSEATKNAETVRRIRQTIATCEEKARQFNSREGLFNQPVTEYSELGDLSKTFEPFFDLWDCAEKWLSNKETWTNGPFMALDSDAVEANVSTLLRNLAKSAKTFDRIGLAQCNVVAVQVRKEVDDFRPKVPLISALRNPGMRDRHWEELAAKTGAAIPAVKTSMSLQDLCDMGLVNATADVEKIAEKSSKEFGIEVALDKMTKAWETVPLIVELYRDTGTCILKGVDEYMSLLDEHITMTQAMAFSAFKGPFEERIDRWNASLQTISEVIDEWIALQRNWLYLQPIFDSADINKQLPQEGKRFATVDKYWRSTMALAIKGVLCVKFCDDARLLERFREGNKLMDAVQKGLADYLETKRAGFSRFYFLSNDELLEILSETKDPLRVQPHLRKCFEGIKGVDFQPDLTITGMTSPEGEKVPFVSAVDPKNKNIETWMVELKDAMVRSVRDAMYHAILDYTETSRTDWMQKWPAQCILNGSQLHWTREVEELLNASGNDGCWQYYNQLVKQLQDMVILIRGDISKLARVTVGALAVVDVHARDVQKKMAESGVSRVSDFDWSSQMRYYWHDGDIKEGKGDLAVIMVSSKRWYGNEYLGNTFRLVITPLTDKCYLTLMGALQMILGGAPAGPAGTGKTETTKDLAKALAKQCVVFNCSDGLDYMAMGKFFKGLAASGAWACFDEFNRINIEVLSVIAQQIIQLQGTVQRGEKKTVFEGTEIIVNPEFAVFITMNPGYAGRAELPDNLEALFRPVAMMVPDYGLIGEIMLFSYGYMENRECAQKMVATFRLCSEQLSSQDHYDYGMRAVKTVITAAGNLKRAAPLENEQALLMRALQDVNVPKFLSQDLPLFAGILGDLFPGIARPAFDYGPLVVALKESILEKNLQPVQLFLRKNIELYEMICVRHGLMVVGPTGGGKSSNIRVLCAALTKLKAKGIAGERYEKTKIYHLNPKSIKMGQLYGAFDENTHEWQDGILCVIIRLCIKEDNPNLKWMLFDGPVDALWIENMNTVLDDNKKLCLTSGEIIQLSDPMTMMFEPEDLAVASPATVSRCGMIYMEPTSLGYDVLFQSWLATVPPNLGQHFKSELSRLFDVWVPTVLPHLRRNMVEPLPTVNNCLVDALLNLLETFLEPFRDREGAEKKKPEDIAHLLANLEQVFIFCMIWSMCCTVNAASRKMFDYFMRIEMFSNKIKMPPPTTGSIYDFKYDLPSNTWIPWVDSASPYVYDPKLSFAELIIPTQDSICYTHLLDTLVLNKKHVLMTGPTGTGKTVNILGHLQNGLPEKYVPITLSFSAQTGANQTQDMIDSKCEKRRKGVFGPSAGKEFIIFVDDVNMPMKEEFGAQPPIEILRQWFDNGGWFDRKALEMRKIIDIQFVCACGPPGGGRNHVTARFYRHFNVINYVDMSDSSLFLIFSTILSNFLSGGFEETLAAEAGGLVNATVNLYNTIIEELRPTPAKPHYTFNMRDISKVFQGMLMMDRRRVQSPSQLARMWVHESSRVFGDRLVNEDDKEWLKQTMEDRLEKFTSLKKEMIWEQSPDLICVDFMVPGAEVKVYEEVNLTDLQSMVEEYLGEYNADSKQPMNLVIFGDAMLHVAKIARVLRQPSGHALLLGVGGSGRQSLTRLATFISGFKLYQIEIAKGYGMNEWRDNVKECLLYAGVSNKPIVFMFNDTQIIKEAMLEDINGILNSGDVPNLYAAEDIEAITTACKPECVKRRIPPTKLNIFAQYLMRVKANVHVVLCMSPLGSAIRTRLRMFPSLVNCCTIDWFMEWPDDALQSVAARFLAASDLGVTPEVEKSLIVFFQFIHQSVERAVVDFLNKMRRRFYVTPTSYLELLSTYNNTLTDKRKEVGTLRDRLTIGVDKLISTERAVNELQATLTKMEPELIKTQADVELMIVQITKDKATAAATKAVVVVEEASANKKAKETKAIADDAQRDLDEALPALAEAVKCLKDLKKADIDEVKSLGRPPVNVVRTLTACCIMFDIKPDMVADPDNPGKKVKDYFKPAQKSLLANANKLLEDMANYDK